MSVNNGNHYNSAIYIRACRSCLNSKPTNYVLLQNEWIDMYKACINVDITDKEQTFALCDNCSTILKQCFEFKEKCLKSEIFWNTLSDTKPISTSNEDEFKKIIKEANVNIKSENLSICADTQDYEDNQIAGDDMVLVVVASKEESESFNNETEQVIQTKDNIKNMNSAREKDLPKKKTKEKSKGKFIGKCDKCCRIFKKRKTIEDHFALRLCKNSKFEVRSCGICNSQEDFKSVNEIKTHLLEHYMNNDLVCGTCGFTGEDFADMLTHRHEHQPNQKAAQTALPCILCTKYCHAVLRAEFHFRRFHLKNGGIKCSHCKKMYTNFKACMNHQRAHFNEYLECNECGKKLRDKERLQAHIRDLHTARKIMCHICGKAFARNMSLKLHMYNMHTSTEKVECDHCNKVFKNEKTLRAHILRIKRGRRHVCNVCEKAFYGADELNHHIKSHTGVRPFECDMCSKNFKTRTRLSEHKKQVHFTHTVKCDECDKMFPTERVLKRHMYFHTGQKPYPCDSCHKSFYSKKQRSDHCERHHSGKVFNKL